MQCHLLTPSHIAGFPYPAWCCSPAGRECFVLSQFVDSNSSSKPMMLFLLKTWSGKINGIAKSLWAWVVDPWLSIALLLSSVSAVLQQPGSLHPSPHHMLSPPSLAASTPSPFFFFNCDPSTLPVPCSALWFFAAFSTFCSAKGFFIPTNSSALASGSGSYPSTGV